MAKSVDPDSSSAEIANFIDKDPALMVSWLKIFNSAYFGLPRKMESVKDAVSWVGLIGSNCRTCFKQQHIAYLQ